MNDGMTTARVRIRRWVRAEMDGKTEVKLPEIADAARDTFLADAAFLNGPIGDLIRAVAYEEAAAFCGDTRSGLVQFGETATSRGDIDRMVERKARVRKNPFATWMEHAGDRNINLLEMTREELLAAAEERAARGRTELVIARTWREMAKKLEGGQVVRERFTADEIAALYATIRRGKAA